MPKSEAPIIWLYLGNFVFKSIAKDDPRLDFMSAPKGMVRFTPRKGSKDNQYVYWGFTGTLAAQKANQPVLENIRKLEELLQDQRRLLVNPPPKSG